MIKYSDEIKSNLVYVEYAQWAGQNDLAEDWESSFGDPAYYGYADESADADAVAYAVK